jgi:hypothetical protein
MEDVTSVKFILIGHTREPDPAQVRLSIATAFNVRSWTCRQHRSMSACDPSGNAGGSPEGPVWPRPDAEYRIAGLGILELQARIPTAEARMAPFGRKTHAVRVGLRRAG